MADDDTKTDDDTKGTDTGPDYKAEAEKWKALARKHEDQAKKNHDALEKLKADADASKSDMDKVTEKLSALEKRAEEAERKALIAEVAANKKLPGAIASRLKGSTREELESDADELLEAFGGGSDKDETKNEDDKSDTNGDTAKSKSAPKEKLKGGASTSDQDDAPDPDKLADKILSRGRI